MSVMTDATRGEMSLLALSHTPAEHKLYEVLLAESAGGASAGHFPCSLRRLMTLTGLSSYSTLRRARAGLIAKLSIDCPGDPAASARRSGSHYQIYRPAEVFKRRRVAGLDPYPKEYRTHAAQQWFLPAVGRVVGGYNLSRREAQVALCCAEGLTNSEIGSKLFITEQTVKFHLRHVFVKFGVSRRGELISRLLRSDDEQSPALRQAAAV
jgi:DNA-binding CsgD family transcriptional regulator